MLNVASDQNHITFLKGKCCIIETYILRIRQHDAAFNRTDFHRLMLKFGQQNVNFVFIKAKFLPIEHILIFVQNRDRNDGVILPMKTALSTENGTDREMSFASIAETITFVSITTYCMAV